MSPVCAEDAPLGSVACGAGIRSKRRSTRDRSIVPVSLRSQSLVVDSGTPAEHQAPSLITASQISRLIFWLRPSSSSGLNPFQGYCARPSPATTIRSVSACTDKHKATKKIAWSLNFRIDCVVFVNLVLDPFHAAHSAPFALHTATTK